MARVRGIGPERVAGTHVAVETNARTVALSMELTAKLLGVKMEAALVEGALILREGIRRNFESEGEHFGARWHELADQTLRNKAARGHGGNQILHDFGVLEHNLLSDEKVGVQITNFYDEVHVGTDDWRAHFHQFGTEKMPARPIVGVAPVDAVAIFKIFDRAVDEAIAAGAGMTRGRMV